MKKKIIILGLSFYLIFFVTIKGAVIIKEFTTPLITKGIGGWLIPPYKTAYDGVVISSNFSAERFLSCEMACFNKVKNYKKCNSPKIISLKKLLQSSERIHFLLLDIKLDCCEKNHCVILKASSNIGIIVWDPLYGDVFIRFNNLKKIWKGKAIVISNFRD